MVALFYETILFLLILPTKRWFAKSLCRKGHVVIVPRSQCTWHLVMWNFIYLLNVLSQQRNAIQPADGCGGDIVYFPVSVWRQTRWACGTFAATSGRGKQMQLQYLGGKKWSAAMAQQANRANESQRKGRLHFDCSEKLMSGWAKATEVRPPPPAPSSTPATAYKRWRHCERLCLDAFTWNF